MSYNVNSTLTVNNIGHGPAELFMGAAGTTPTVDVGFMGEEGQSQLEYVSTKAKVKQGNPALSHYKWMTVQEVYLAWQGMEWNLDQLAYGLGAGTTTSSASQDTLIWGGDPCVDEVAIHLRHYMCKAVDTINVYAWTCTAEDDVNFQFSQEGHTFPYRYELMYSSQDWAGNSLGNEGRLLKIVRQKT